MSDATLTLCECGALVDGGSECRHCDRVPGEPEHPNTWLQRRSQLLTKAVALLQGDERPEVVALLAEIDGKGEPEMCEDCYEVYAKPGSDFCQWCEADHESGSSPYPTLDPFASNAEFKISLFRTEADRLARTDSSGVRVDHLPTGLWAESDDTRFPHKNRETAMKLVQAKVAEHARSAPYRKEMERTRIEHAKREKEDHVRSLAGNGPDSDEGAG